MIQIVMMVCRLAQPDMCEEQRLPFAGQETLQRCAMAAQIYIAQWVGEHPQWEIRNFRCENAGTRDRAETPNPL